MCFTRILFFIDYRLHMTSVFIWVEKLFAIPTHLSSTHVIVRLPFLVRHDFFTLVKFLTHRLAFFVGSTVAGRAPISSESNILGQVPHCRQAAFCVIPRQPYVKQHHLHTKLQRCFSFILSLSCIPNSNSSSLESKRKEW